VCRDRDQAIVVYTAVDCFANGSLGVAVTMKKGFLMYESQVTQILHSRAAYYLNMTLYLSKRSGPFTGGPRVGEGGPRTMRRGGISQCFELRHAVAVSEFFLNLASFRSALCDWLSADGLSLLERAKT
jgi:hypothetical protein